MYLDWTVSEYPSPLRIYSPTGKRIIVCPTLQRTVLFLKDSLSYAYKELSERNIED